MSDSNDTFAANPFTLVFSALWSLLESSPNFVADVQQNNRIHFDINNIPDARKMSIQDSDLPEVILVAEGASEVNLYNTSATSRIIKNYSFLLSTGDVRINNYLYQVEWDIFCGMTGWQKILGGLEWGTSPSNHFVKSCNLTSITEGIADNERNRGLVGWSAIWSCSVEMQFLNSDLATYRGY